jgi:hypothetical protein
MFELLQDVVVQQVICVDFAIAVIHQLLRIDV